MALATMTPEDAGGLRPRSCAIDGRVARIVEDKDAGKAERGIAEINGGLYAFDVAWLRARIARSDAVDGDRRAVPDRSSSRWREPTHGGSCRVEIEDETELRASTIASQLATVEADMRWRILERHLLAGRDHAWTRPRPSSTPTSSSAEDVILEPNVILRGDDPDRPRHASSAAGSQLVDSHGRRALPDLGQRARSRRWWGTTCSIGPFAHLRARLRRSATGAELGNFAEVKASRIGPRARSSTTSATSAMPTWARA